VGGAYPGFGSAHGFSFTAPVGPGPHTICAYAINSGAGNANTQLGCRTLMSDPLGTVDSVAREPGGSVRVAGWAFDPDTSGSIDVGVFVNGTPWAAARADVDRPDLAGAGFSTTHHGYSIALQGLTTSPVEVCVLAINVGPGTFRNLGCRTIDARRVPFGSLDNVSVVDNGVRVRGWAIDPDTASSIPVHVYVDGRFDRATTANASRPDVGAAFDGWGDAHGYDVVLPDQWISDHDVCVYAINVGLGGENPLLGCRRVRPAGEPFGSVDALTRVAGGYRVAGWAIDPNMVYPAEVAIYVDGVRTTVVADRDRPDVGNAYPFYGGWHGFDTVVPASVGNHQVCVWALNVGQGMSHRILTCRVV
jgi:hypothetical protein